MYVDVDIQQVCLSVFEIGLLCVKVDCVCSVVVVWCEGRLVLLIVWCLVVVDYCLV